MKLLRPLIVGLVALTFFIAQPPRDSEALFHLAVIDEVMTSYGGDPDVQFVEIEMLSGSQNFVAHSILASFGTSGAYIGDVLEVPTDVANSGNGVRWLMATSQFQTDTGLTPDFIMPAGLLAGGGMLCWGAPVGPGGVPPNPPTWNRTVFSNYVDCIAYGTYSGPTNVHIGNPTPLDGDGHTLERIAHTDNNLLDIVCGDPATPRNNAGSTVSLAATTSCDPDSDGDGEPDASDNCPYWPNPGQGLPPWMVPSGDSDCDGWPSTIAASGRGPETTIGTDPSDMCADTGTAFNERGPGFGEPLSPQPPDFNDDRFVDITDINLMGPPIFNLAQGNGVNPFYDARFDLSADDFVDIVDVNLMGPPVFSLVAPCPG